MRSARSGDDTSTAFWWRGTHGGEGEREAFAVRGVQPGMLSGIWLLWMRMYSGLSSVVLKQNSFKSKVAQFAFSEMTALSRILTVCIEAVQAEVGPV
mmetsp:Transcript_17727/g.47136  ORF Transcript_17727/g.47136 Transcript_17727/m.47136 type:complete len:97 (+) Transcript_17727:1046-1336(+)